MNVRRGGLVLGLVAALSAGVSRAETVAVLVVSATDLTEGQQQFVVDAAEASLRTVSALKVKGQGRRSILVGPSKRCGTDLDCLIGLAQATGTDHGLMLSLAVSQNELVANGFWVDVLRHKAVYRQAPAVPVAQSEDAAKNLVESLLPGFLRKGWGGVALDADAGATVKADGHKVASTPLSGPLALTEGPHDVDVVYPSGQAMLQHVLVVEGQRTKLRVSMDALPSLSGDAEVQSETIQNVAYGLWAAGAVAIAGSLIAGGLSHQATADLRPCSDTDRTTCDTFGTYQSRLQRAEALANTANIMLISGGVLSAGGAGLFTFDLIQRSKWK